MSVSETIAYSISVVLQFAAIVFCLRMAFRGNIRGPWLLMTVGLFGMLIFRVLRLLTAGAQPLLSISEHTLQYLAAISSLIISLFLFLSLFGIRRLSLAQQQATKALVDANHAIEQRAAQLQAIFQSMTEGLYIGDPAGNLVTMNPAALMMHEFKTVQEVIQKLKDYPALFELRQLSGEFLPLERWPISRVLRGERFVEYEVQVRRSDTGRQAVLSYSGTPVIDAAGKLELAVLTFRDVTQQRDAERTLIQSQRRLQSLFDTTQDAILLADDEARYVDANPAACELSGYAREELLQRTVWDLTPLPARASSSELWREFVRAGRHAGEFPLLRKDGQTVAVEYRAMANIVPGVHLSVLRDVTQRNQFEAALRENAERLSLAMAAADLGDWVWDATTDVITLSNRAAEIFGIPSGPHMTRTRMRDLLHEDDREAARLAATRAATDRGDYNMEYRVLRGDGTMLWVAAKGRGQYDAEGRIIGMLGVVQDITERKTAEVERERLLESERAAREQAERNSRMKDEFLATLSHELRTPLNAILGWAQILRGSSVPTAEDLSRGLETIERNARAQTKIIEDLLDMSRIISGKVRLDVQRIDLPPVIEAAIETVRHAAEAKGVRLQVTLDPQAGPVSGDGGRLQQVFWNLLSNAVKFSARGGSVRVLLERINSHVEVSVIDDGDGIKPEFLPYVFERFRQADGSTTRRHGGLGLGLSIVKQLVELHGGTVRAMSPGERLGSSFIVSLPLTAVRADAAADRDRRHPAVRPDLTGIPADACLSLSGIRILVVDDEADARMLVKRVLEDCEAVVSTAGSVEEALDLIGKEKFDILISDVGMPHEDGYALIRRVRTLAPEVGGKLPAVALTAYARSDDRTRAMLAGFQTHITKPVEPAELVATVAGLTGRTGARESMR